MKLSLSNYLNSPRQPIVTKSCQKIDLSNTKDSLKIPDLNSYKKKSLNKKKHKNNKDNNGKKHSFTSYVNEKQTLKDKMTSLFSLS